MAWYDGLTGAALRIAETKERPLRVMSGPGTGKTFALKRLVTRLLEEGVEPGRILVVTFTRTAANDLVKELQQLKAPGCEKVIAGTLHSYCFQLLLRNDVFDYLGRYPRPLITFKKSGALQFEGGPLIEDLEYTQFGGKRNCSKKLLAFEAAWARLQRETPGWSTDPTDQIFQDRLLQWLTFHQAMLIGEVVPETLRYLRLNPTCPECDHFDQVIVDEYQDLNKAEQELLNIISKGNLVIVGDEDQSIYRFRHANPEGIIEFKNIFPDTHDESLIECRRCPKKVVGVANELIHQNHLTDPRVILASKEDNPEGEIHIVQWDSMDEEATEISNYVQFLINSHRYTPGEILILSPRRLMGYQIRDSLLEAGIAAHSFYHEEALEDTEAQKAFALLSILANPDDRVALRFWLGADSPTFLKGEYAILRAECERLNLSPWDLLAQAVSNSAKLKGVSHLLSQFRLLAERIKELKPLSGQNLFDQLFPPDQSWAKILREAIEMDERKDVGVTDLYQKIRDQITQPELPESGEFIKIMSLHKSKGLSSKVVLVVGCIQGLIPTRDVRETPQEQAGTLKEQRRLFYVVITRAKELLVLSSARQMEREMAHKMGAILRKGSEKDGIAITSQFIGELGPSAPMPKVGLEWKEKSYV